MIPFFRSLSELMVITQGRDELIKDLEFKDSKYNYENERDNISYRESKIKKLIKLPDLKKASRSNWIEKKEAISKLLDELDYNNQIQSSYDLTLINRQQNYNKKDVA